MEWIEHHSSNNKNTWNPTAGRVTALTTDDGGMYRQVILEKYPGVLYRWDYEIREFVKIPNVITMEEAQAVCLALYKMEG